MREITDTMRIIHLVNMGAHFYVGHSGGKDSQAMYALLVKLVPADQLHVVHADLGDVEWTGVKDHIRANIESPLLIAKAIHADGSPKDFFSAVRARRAALDASDRHDAPAFPSSAARFCTSDLKTGPIWKVIRSEGHSLVVNCVGIRGAESPARGKKIASRGTLNLNKKNTNSTRTAYDWWPIADWHCSTDRDFDPAVHQDDVFGEILEAGQSPHPAYQLQVNPLDSGLPEFETKGNERLSCVFCIFGSTNDLRHGAQAKPELLQRYVELETETRGTLFNGKSLTQRINGE